MAHKRYVITFTRRVISILSFPDIKAAETHARAIATTFPDDACKVLSVYEEDYIAPPEEEKRTSTEKMVDGMRKRIDELLPPPKSAA